MVSPVSNSIRKDFFFWFDMGDDPIKNNGVSISYFDHSVENFTAFMDSIKKLCGLPGDESFDASEIERFSSMITFLK